MNDKFESVPPPPIGAQIRNLRKEGGLTLSELARLSNTSTPTMHRYESGWDRFELNTLQKIATALGAALEVRLIPAGEPPLPPRPPAEEILTSLAPLFWDHELKASDLGQHGEWVLGRVLMFGSSTQVRAARAFYGDDAIRRAVRRRDVDPRTRNYWELILEEPCTPRF